MNNSPMPTSSFTDEQRREIKDLVVEAMTEYFASTGMVAKNVILTTAGIVGALVVIGGGIKTLLSWLGFVYIR